MTNNWKKYKLGEIGTLARGKSKNRPRDAAHLYGGNYPFIQTGDIKAANHRIYNYTQTYSEAGLQQSKLWPKNTLCLTIAANIGDTAIINFAACFPDSILGFIANEKICDIEYIEYLLQHYKKEIQSHSIGSVQDNINLGTFERVEFTIPDLKEQQAIAEILSSLDDKIELNLQTNKTLEEMANALYKHWFVDFGPFKDGKFIESELGLIPDGWEVKNLEKVADIGSSKRIFLNEYVSSGIPFYRGREIIELSKNNSINTELFISTEKFEEIKDKFGAPKEGDILLTSVGTIGKSYLVGENEVFYFKDGNLTWIKKYTSYLNPHFIFQWLNSKETKVQIESIKIGSTQEAITIQGIRTLKIIIPSKESHERIDFKLKEFCDLIKANNKENESLKQTRDYLLPKLISGEIQVKEAIKKVKAIL